MTFATLLLRLMRHTSRAVHSLILAVWLLAGVISAAAQVTRPTRPSTNSDSSTIGSIRGKVTLAGGAFVTENLRVTLQTIRGVEATIYTDNQGRFEFPKLSPGRYQIVVEGDRLRYEPSTENVEVIQGPYLLTIVLKEKETPAKPKATAISAIELDPKIPEKARKEFERASLASKEGKSEEAIAHLRKAIAIYPRYLMARNDLGTILLGQGNLPEAADELRRAIEIDPKAFNPHLNLGIVLVYQQRFPQAVETLREALSLKPDSPSARLYSGLAFLGLEDLVNAERELKAAHDLGGVTYAVALFHLGKLYMNQGHQEQAAKMFETYLREAPHGDNVAEARRLMAMMR